MTKIKKNKADQPLFSIKLALLDGWNMVFGQGWLLILYSILFVILPPFAYSFISKVFQFSLSTPYWLNYFVSFFNFLITIFLFRVAMSLYRGEKIQIKGPNLEWFLTLWKPLSVSVLNLAVIFPSMTIMVVLTVLWPVIITRNALPLLPKILLYFGFSVAFLYFFTVVGIRLMYLFLSSLDPEKKGRGFLKSGVNLSMKNVAKLFVMMVLSALIVLFAIIFSLGLLAPITFSMVSFAYTSAYYQIQGKRNKFTNLTKVLKKPVKWLIAIAITTIIWVVFLLYLLFSFFKMTAIVDIQVPTMLPDVPRAVLLAKKLNSIEQLSYGEIVAWENRAGRIVGLPGDTISFKDGSAFRNGEVIIEDIINPVFSQSSYVLVEDEVFVLADQREYFTEDSRNWGPIKFDMLDGIVYPNDLVLYADFTLEIYELIDEINTFAEQNSELSEIKINKGFKNGYYVFVLDVSEEYLTYPKVDSVLTDYCLQVDSLIEKDEETDVLLLVDDYLVNCRTTGKAIDTTGLNSEGVFHVWMSTLPKSLRERYDDLRLNGNFAGSANELRAWEGLLAQYDYAAFHYAYALVNQRMYVQLGGAAQANTYLQTALKHYRKAVEIEPNLYMPYPKLGYLVWRDRLDDSYLEIFQQGLEYEPNSSEIYGFWSVIEEEKGNYQKAHELQQQAVSSNVDHPEHEAIKESLVCLERRTGLKSGADFYKKYGINLDVETILCDSAGNRTKL
jgi:signal peptidase I